MFVVILIREMINEFLGLLMTSLKVSFCIIEFSFFIMIIKRVFKTSILLVMGVKKKSLTELEELVVLKGLSFGMDLSKYKLDKD